MSSAISDSETGPKAINVKLTNLPFDDAIKIVIPFMNTMSIQFRLMEIIEKLRNEYLKHTYLSGINVYWSENDNSDQIIINGHKLSLFPANAYAADPSYSNTFFDTKLPYFCRIEFSDRGETVSGFFAWKTSTEFYEKLEEILKDGGFGYYNRNSVKIDKIEPVEYKKFNKTTRKLLPLLPPKPIGIEPVSTTMLMMPEKEEFTLSTFLSQALPFFNRTLHLSPSRISEMNVERVNHDAKLLKLWEKYEQLVKHVAEALQSQETAPLHSVIRRVAERNLAELLATAQTEFDPETFDKLYEHAINERDAYVKGAQSFNSARPKSQQKVFLRLLIEQQKRHIERRTWFFTKYPLFNPVTWPEAAKWTEEPDESDESDEPESPKAAAFHTGHATISNFADLIKIFKTKLDKLKDDNEEAEFPPVTSKDTRNTLLSKFGHRAVGLVSTEHDKAAFIALKDLLDKYRQTLGGRKFARLRSTRLRSTRSRSRSRSTRSRSARSRSARSRSARSRRHRRSISNARKATRRQQQRR